MAVRETLRCPACQHDRPAVAFGLTPQGNFDADSAYTTELSRRRDSFEGRGRIRVTREPLDARHALGMRNMLKHRLAQVEAELREAGVELSDD